MIVMENLDAVFTQRSDVDGLTKAEILALLEHLGVTGDDEVYPVIVDGEFAMAFGFIRNEIANRVNLDVGKNSSFARELLTVVNDTRLESTDHLYSFAGIRTLMYY